MTVAGQPSFESLREDVRTASPASSPGERRIRWVDQRHSLAFARDQEGRLELFLVGPAVAAGDTAVREHLVHNTWLDSSGEPVLASRLWLPGGDHYDAAAATILIELLKNGYPVDEATGFARTEPLIALVLSRAVSEGSVVTGLAGELLTLVALMRTDPTAAGNIVTSWAGSQPSARDFQLGPVGIEVKTSTTTASRHHIQGWYQVEPGVAVGGGAETHLYLLSIGIEWLPHGYQGHTIEELVGQVIDAQPASERATFIDKVRSYGGGEDFEIDEEGNAAESALRRPFRSTFERLFDMADDRIKVPRSGDLAAFEHVVLDSVSFEVALPARVRGDVNPIHGFPAITAALHRSASG